MFWRGKRGHSTLSYQSPPLHRTRSGQSQKHPLPLMCCNCEHFLAWLTTMPSFFPASPVCCPLCIGCCRRLLRGLRAQKRVEHSRSSVQFDIIKCANPLQPQVRTVLGLWHISLWSGCRFVTQDGRWVNETYRLCQPFPESSWEAILPAWRRRSSHCVWD